MNGKVVMCKILLVSKSSKNVIFAKIQTSLLEDAASSHPPKIWFAKNGPQRAQFRALHNISTNLAEVSVNQNLSFGTDGRIS